MTQNLTKVPPQDLEAEKALIASVIIDKDALDEVIDKLDENLFYQEKNKYICNAIKNLYDRYQVIDLITIRDELEGKGNLDKAGGYSYLIEITENLPTTENVVYYYQIVRDKAELRSLIKTCQDIMNLSYVGFNDPKDLVDKAEKMIFDVSERRLSKGPYLIKNTADETLKEIEEMYKKGDKFTGIPSGFYKLDEMTSGFQNSDLIILAARPAMGKTAFALNLAEHIGINEKKVVAIFSLEMNRRDLTRRILCSVARMNIQKVRGGNISSNDFQPLIHAASKISEAKIFIDDTPAISTFEIRAKARRLKAKYGLDILMLDYLQLVKLPSGTRIENRQNEVASISMSLKELARELDIPVIALSQLARRTEQREDKKPHLSDLRDSGSLEQDADIVMFIHRDEYYDRENTDLRGQADVIIAKQRNGPTGDVKLTFIDHCTRFENYLPPQEF